MGATIKDIAKKTGLGLATISKYLNGGNVLEVNKIAIEEAIEELDFRVNEFARGLKTSKSKTIGVIIPELNNLFCTSIITIITDRLRQHGYGVIVCDCRTDETLECEAVEFLVNKRVDGIINMPVSKSGDHLKLALSKQIPVVLIDRKIHGLEVDAVVIDNIGISEEAINNLIQEGHTEIGIICGPQDIFTSQQRLLGYQQALIKQGMMPDLTLVKYADYTVEGGYQALKEILEGNKKVTAVFITNYEMTLGAILAINELGIKIPEDLSLIGFDNMQLAQIIKPRLTIVDQPLQEIGEKVSEIMLKRLLEESRSNSKVIHLLAEIVKGESVRNIKENI